MNDKILKTAQTNHRKNTKHVHIIVGMNFIECMDCKKHAHLTEDNRLIHHNADYTVNEYIDPDQF